MKLLFKVLFAAAAATGSVMASAEAASPYAGQEAREIKALSPAEVEGLLAGKGMGYGKTAELNRYPGPAHVLELSSELGLTEEQLRATRDIHARMEMRAKAVGAQVIAAEAALERSFRDGAVNEDTLKASLGEIAQLQAELRAVHLTAHLEQHRVLSAEQIDRYVHLRGYHHGDGARAGHGH